MKYFICLILIVFCSANSAFSITEGDENPFIEWGKSDISLSFGETNGAVLLRNAYEDTYLSGYMQKALEGNYSIKIAKDRIMQYKDIQKGVNSIRLPWVSISPQANSQRNISLSSGNYSESGFYSLPMQLNWELDIWGKNSLKYKIAKLDVKMKEQELQMMNLSISSDMAVAYYNLILSDYLISNANDRLLNLQETIKLKKSLYENGIISFDDIYFLENEYSQTIEELKQNEKERDLFLNQIYVLMGKVPHSDAVLDRSKITDKAFSSNLIIQEPQLLMFKRPDVKISEIELEKAGIDVRIAKKELLPVISLNGIFGFSSLNFLDLINWYSRVYQIGMQLVQDIFTGGYKKSNIEYKKQVEKEKVHNYYGIILNAIKETTDALVVLNNDYQSYLEYKKLCSESEQYGTLIYNRYKNGLAGKIDYLNAQRQLSLNDKFFNVYKSKVFVDLINLNKSLGVL